MICSLYDICTHTHNRMKDGILIVGLYSRIRYVLDLSWSIKESNLHVGRGMERRGIVGVDFLGLIASMTDYNH